MAEAKIGGSWFKMQGRTFLSGLLVGCLIGALLCFGAIHYNPPDRKDVDTTVILGQIHQINELATAAQTYTIVEKVTDSNRLFDLVDIPFTGNSFILVYSGTLKAGVNMELAEIHSDPEAKVVRVTLPQAQILSNTVDKDSYRTLDERNNVFNMIHVEDVTGYLNEAQIQSEEAALRGPLLEEAQENAKMSVSEILNAALPEGYAFEIAVAEAESSQ